MRALLVLFIVALSGCAILANPATQECLMPLAKAIILTATGNDAADAWLSVVTTTIRVSNTYGGFCN